MNELTRRKKTVLVAGAVAILGGPVIIGFLTQATALAQQTEESGRPQFNIAEMPWQPIVRVAPVYPQRALEQGLDGYVRVQYTVTEAGSVEDVVVLESSSNVFEEAAVESVRKYKYEARVVNGEPVRVPGVETLIQFELEDEGPEDEDDA